MIGGSNREEVAHGVVVTALVVVVERRWRMVWW